MDARFKVGDLVRGHPSRFDPICIGIVIKIDNLSWSEPRYYVHFPDEYLVWLYACYLELVPEDEAALYVLGSNI